MLKSAYVGAMRVFAVPLRACGALAWMERAPRDSLRFWLASQFAIYDAAQLTRLDVPWWSFPAIRAVEQWLARRNGEVRAFEYGSGASTVWLARRCRSVVSIEHDASFLRSVAPLITRDNVELRLVEPEPSKSPRTPSGRKGHEHQDFTSYVDAIGSDRYDLIVIDGRARDACLARATQQLADGGLIVFDNTERRRYADALARIQRPMKRYRGWAPALPYRSETTLIGNPPEELR
jgi:predicted O-methyltransferase YrrM